MCEVNTLTLMIMKGWIVLKQDLDIKMIETSVQQIQFDDDISWWFSDCTLIAH